MSGGFWAGVDIGGTKTAVVLSSEPPSVLCRTEFPTLPEEGPERALISILRAIHQSMSEQGLDRGGLTGIGVSCGGPLDSTTGRIQAPPNLSTWVDVPITSILGKEFGVPCRLENDAKAGASTGAPTMRPARLATCGSPERGRWDITRPARWKDGPVAEAWPE